MSSPVLRLIRQDDIAGFVQAMEGYRDELQAAELGWAPPTRPSKGTLSRLGTLFNPGDYPPSLRTVRRRMDFPSIEPPPT